MPEAGFPVTDHPRIRGEHAGMPLPAVAAGGIIPAYAGSTVSTSKTRRGAADHPRIRGEHASSVCAFRALVGSSPHTRGAQDPRHGDGVDFRIIPAYAGSTWRHHAMRGASSDHPRIRGEHPWTPFAPSPYAGSSPHTRGAPIFPDPSLGYRRIIPAYAGSTLLRPAETTALVGSSPHTRGAPRHLHLRRQASRIIPAYAGSTGGLLECSPWREDHPRIRGEHRADLYEVSVVAGSSPHTRGAHLSCVGVSETVVDHPRIRGEHSARRRHQGLLLGSSPHTRGARLAGQRGDPGVGIIPAYAGSTKFRSPYYNAAQDHPRIRGEHLVVGELVAGERGSSPHTRGAPTGACDDRPRGGIIPAYAGSTRAGSICPEITPDHPRIRGEHCTQHPKYFAQLGSSPHTRGAPSHDDRHPHAARIIPAYAGSTARGGRRAG